MSEKFFDSEEVVDLENLGELAKATHPSNASDVPAERPYVAPVEVLPTEGVEPSVANTLRGYKQTVRRIQSEE